MANTFFQFKQFVIYQERCAMKVTTDACLFGAWVASRFGSGGTGVGNLIDVGTGTGLLALMLAQGSNFSIDAIEIDKVTFEQASENIAASPWSTRVRIFNGDATTFEFLKKYDVIISNPPFYEKELKGGDSKKNIAHHNEGLLLSQLFSIIKKNLEPTGSFYLLLPYKRNEEIKSLFSEKDFIIQQLTFVRQTVNHDYFRIMLEGKLKTHRSESFVIETTIDDISIKDSNQQYTQVFEKLLKDYYLHL